MWVLTLNLQLLYQFRFLWSVGEAGVPWGRVGIVLGSVCLANIAVYLLGSGSGGGGFGTVLVSASVTLLGAACISAVGGCMRLVLGVLEVGRCLF